SSVLQIAEFVPGLLQMPTNFAIRTLACSRASPSGYRRSCRCRSGWTPSPTTSPTRRQPAFAPRRSSSRPFSPRQATPQLPSPRPARATFRARRARSQTDNPLDVAVQGDAWLGIQTPGGTAYTRDGRLRMTPTGELQTLTGHAVLDTGGAPILLDPTGGPPRIGRDGTITQNNVAA